MSAVVVIVTEGDDVDESHITDSVELEAAVDADITAFDEYFQRELKNDEPLSKSERAIVKTYLWWKTHQEKPHAG